MAKNQDIGKFMETGKELQKLIDDGFFTPGKKCDHILGYRDEGYESWLVYESTRGGDSWHNLLKSDKNGDYGTLFKFCPLCGINLEEN